MPVFTPQSFRLPLPIARLNKSNCALWLLHVIMFFNPSPTHLWRTNSTYMNPSLLQNFLHKMVGYNVTCYMEGCKIIVYYLDCMYHILNFCMSRVTLQYSNSLRLKLLICICESLHIPGLTVNPPGCFF